MKMNLFLSLFLGLGCAAATGLEAITLAGIGDVTFGVQHPVHSKYAFDPVESGYLTDEANDSSYHYVYQVEEGEIIGAVAEKEGGEVGEIYTNSDNFETTYHAQVGKTLNDLKHCNLGFELLDGEGGAYFAYERNSQTLLAFDDFLELEGINTCKPVLIKTLLKKNPSNSERRITNITLQKTALPPLMCD